MHVCENIGHEIHLGRVVVGATINNLNPAEFIMARKWRVATLLIEMRVDMLTCLC